ncbi:DAZ-associated protein 2-like [Mercenaria mercenaria]|uniref:DAZ-associated protein 2-like n=1 Tax=Mercenaria mercenaria TaxID=6596 RepID=UPI00234F2434|nr:DAZ-associated protein 2-like [Mercenaria mercenaria]
MSVSDKYRLPDDKETVEPPPEYTVSYPTGTQQQSTIIIDSSAGVFHKGARFDEFAKPSIPPPPPGCPPNHLQQMQMEKGQLNVVLSNPSTGQHHYENHGFSEDS